jgi:hypothetical protein
VEFTHLSQEKDAFCVEKQLRDITLFFDNKIMLKKKSAVFVEFYEFLSLTKKCF